jgi:hypothetical protein
VIQSHISICKDIKQINLRKAEAIEEEEFELAA